MTPFPMGNLWTNSATPAPPLTLERMIEMILRMMWGPREHDERYAFRSLGGLGFAAHRRARRRRLWERAVAIAKRVGHGDTVKPLVVFPDVYCVPMDSIEQIEREFDDRQRELAKAMRLQPEKVWGALFSGAGIVTRSEES